MTSRILAFALAAAATGGTAFADEPVHARATVEVLDDKTQIDDVISRFTKDAAHDATTTSDLKSYRPNPPPPTDKDLKRNGPPKPPPTHRVHHDHAKKR